MSNEKYWIILNVSGAENRPVIPTGMLIPDRHKPTVIQTDRDTAEREVLRLKECFPGFDFVLFESVAYASKSPVTPGVYHVEPITAHTPL